MILADFHIHSSFSRATSKDLDLPHLELWARRKGLQVVGTGDVTHPGQVERIRACLEEAEPGLFKLSESCRLREEWLPGGEPGPVRFCLTGEISNIYKRGGRVRKVHNVVFLSGLDGLERFRERLGKVGNLLSDGRPILGLDSRDLLEILLEADPEGWLVPAHIWTPWFSVLGSKSGFDALEECYGDLTDRIFALETGLSSDPPMNDCLSALDGYRLISCSDAHSAPNLMREATLFDCPLSLPELRRALEEGDPEAYKGTLEFFPEEGKYHLDGHRKCGIRWTPEETRRAGGVCPVCGKPVTVGVLSRVVELADREREAVGKGKRPFLSLLPLPSLLGSVLDKGPSTKGVQRLYRGLLEKLGSEFQVLTEVPLQEIARVGGALAAEGVRRARLGEIRWEAGFDGEYGRPILFLPGERERLAGEKALFEFAVEHTPPGPVSKGVLLAAERGGPSPREAGESPRPAGLLDPFQREAVEAPPGPLLVQAPPGSGKTRTLVARAARKLAQGIPPERIFVVTFTRKAARELEERLLALPDLAGKARGIRAGTIHALCRSILEERGRLKGRRITGRSEAERLLQWAAEKAGLPWEKETARVFFLGRIRGELPGELLPLEKAYQEALRERGRIDLDGLLLETLELLRDPAEAARIREGISFLAVDEYQDVDPTQAALLDLLAGPGGDFTAIGDPDQAIYSFRGGDASLFHSFPSRHPGTRVVRLRTNYRSSPALVRLTRVLASGPVEPVPGRRGGRAFLYSAPTVQAEAEFVAHEIEKLLGGVSHFSMDSGRSEGSGLEVGFGDMAVLYRTRSQEPPLEEALSRLGIPYWKGGGLDALSRRGLAFLSSSIRVLLDQADDLDLEALFWGSAGSRGWKAARLLSEKARKSGLSPGRVLETPGLVRGIQGSERKRMEELARVLPSWRSLALRDPLEWIRQAGTWVQERGLHPGPGWMEVLEELVGAEGLEGAADRLSRERLPDLASRHLQRVTLSTLHGSKGLEFAVVFLVGLEEGILPSREGAGASDPEEERRLFYVGLTRAAARVYLSWSRSRLVHGKKAGRKPSPFLAELPGSFLEEMDTAPGKKRPRGPRQQTLFGE